LNEFMGYRRADGKAGVRNKVVVMPGVACAEAAARKIAEAAGAAYLQNPHGCGQTQADTARTLHIMSGLISNPNVYGALIVGLGCETIGEEEYRTAISARAPFSRVEYIGIQSSGGLGATVEKGVMLVERMQADAAGCRRVSCDISELILGLECGGSDPTSGISANVVLGEVSDMLVDAGGTAVLSETVEAIGAEDVLRSRGVTAGVGQMIYDCIRDKDRAFAALGEDIRKSNPSPGNIRSGISTLEEKSLGCINKSGTRPFTALIGYGDQITARGVVFMDTTAFDAASITAKIAGGCQVIAFTTGLGTPIGSAIAPVIKITGNRDTYDMMTDMLDFQTSGTLTGEKTVQEAAQELRALMLRVCSGELVKAEINGADVISVDQFNMLA